jgi:hypothetical protein
MNKHWLESKLDKRIADVLERRRYAGMRLGNVVAGADGTAVR